MGCIQSRDKPDPYNGKSTPCETADDGAPHSSVSPAMAATPTAPAATIAAASSNGRSGLEGVPLGVNVDFLKSFLLQIQPVIAEAELDMITTKDVCDLFIIPETRDRGCAYIDLVRERDELCEHVKPANVFVSHAWKYSFEQLIRTAIRYGEEGWLVLLLLLLLDGFCWCCCCLLLDGFCWLLLLNGCRRSCREAGLLLD